MANDGIEPLAKFVLRLTFPARYSALDYGRFLVVHPLRIDLPAWAKLHQDRLKALFPKHQVDSEVHTSG